MAKITLTDIVSLPAFEEGGNLLYKATGMILSFYDEEGKVVFYPAECRCEFCNLIQSSPEGKGRCLESDKQAAERALREGMPVFYTCHAGLVDVVVPVVVGGERIGCFFSGQSLLSAPTEDECDAVRKNAQDLDIDADRLAEAYRLVPVVEKETLDLALGLLRVVCHHIVEGELALRQERQIALEQRKLRKAAEEKARLERDLRETELRLVSAQLNPHFLFNALNLIMGHAMQEDAPQTTHLVEELALLLRKSLTNIGSMVALSEEVDGAQAYIDVFKARFVHPVHLLVDIPEEVTGHKVPSLMLQPLVENALIHALPHCKGDFRIRVKAERVGDHIELRVSDNGPGLSRGEMNVLNRSLRDPRSESKLTGLTGVYWRLRYYYDRAASLRLEQTKEGFCAVAIIPTQTGSADESHSH